ncbi:MAG: hypothetical protein COT91_05410 [Candidatus Doudnabacteria bacterium CG10_big_fil_rev_8_21_14_0_10_41_10]|uniref:Glycogen synthase n=1 Tax=Candidatus Doudnabacteria bacterium CG10_big_fil_rev_8_21_14_0_10_41_10 TaxID=1974551 RepID=A0A2H0VC76_9BACT|nr:MAG: hypothetical protein COT91_05410 [Candidatus Doudnabacteria bacterium CG10_big_fil_rev_8_21_14_0_10_41_10]
MKVLFVSSEVAPFAKVGGLADVVSSLPKKLKRVGVDVRVLIPHYQQTKLGMLRAKIVGDTKIFFGNKFYKVKIFQAFLPGSRVPIYLLQQKKWFTNPPEIYGKPTINKKAKEHITKRFLFLSVSVLQILKNVNFEPDLIHIHDWPVAPVAGLLKSQKKIKIKSLLTLHNAAQQTSVPKKLLKSLGIANQTSAQINLLKLGIQTADAVNTVSPTYAKELGKKQFSGELAATIRGKKISGILNGIDTTSFDPNTDPYLWTKYSAKTLAKKIKNKSGLQKNLNLLNNKSLLLVGMVTRLFHQKGIELLVQAMENLTPGPFQFVILGTGSKKYHEILSILEKKFPKKICFIPEFDRHLARQIYAGSDVFAMPSLFEPCGLGQMIAHRYGTLPVARDTGGLHDTVVNYNKKGGNGFIFKKFTGEAFIKSLEEARVTFQNKKLWKKLQFQAMSENHSWNRSTKEYLKLYKKIIK